MKLIFFMQINMKLSYMLVLPISVDMFSHTQIIQNNKFPKLLQYIKNGQVCWY